MSGVVVFSGGVDSTTLLYHLLGIHKVHDLLAVSFAYGQRHEREVGAAKIIAAKLGIEHQILDLHSIFSGLNSSLLGSSRIPTGDYSVESQKSTVVPNRNMIFLSIAVAIAESTGREKVYYGAHKNDSAVYPDCRPEFVVAVSRAAQAGTYGKIGIFAPFIDKTKTEIVKMGWGMGVPYHLTWSCYQGGEEPCGECGTCIEREYAFAEANKL